MRSRYSAYSLGGYGNYLLKTWFAPMAKDLSIELLFNFRTSSGYLKGTVSKIFIMKPDDDIFTVTIGWGSDVIGTWSRGDYFAEVIFMPLALLNSHLLLHSQAVYSELDDIALF